MWYFAWVLGVALASTAAILNGIWLEGRFERDGEALTPPEKPPS